MSDKTAMEQRLFELKLKMNKAKQLNNQAVLAERRRDADPKWHLKASSENDEKADKDPQEQMLHETADTAGMKNRKKRKSGESETFAWDVFNADTLYRAHDKRINGMGFFPDAYQRQKEIIGDDTFYNSSSSSVVAHKPSEDAKDRLVESLKQQEEKRKKFSRRRMYDDEEDVEWINERNRHFTKKLDRAFGEHTKEIKGNLERGTAI